MAKKLRVGDVIRGYRITNVFGPGMMAISHAATSPAGAKVFFKQYKSPAPTVVWYPQFVAYQNELSARVREGRVSHFAVQQVDAFEEAWGGRCYFQAFEFVENGADLQQLIDAERDQHRETRVAPARGPKVWAQHVTWAKVLMAAVAALHEAGVVHADLKPANAYLIEDPTIGSGFQLKLIDMDFSLLSDRRAPWHGFQGYIGSDNYRSPEHLTRGGVPSTASDVFTCGLMMYELLAGVHPYWSDDQADYARLVQGYAAKPPALLGVMPAADNADVGMAMHRCLSPDPTKRPSAKELQAILSGRGAKLAPVKGAAPKAGASVRKPGSIAPAVPVTVKPVSASEPIMTDRLELQGPDGGSLKIAVRTELGRALVRQFGPDSQFWDERQCVVERRSTREWVVSPNTSATNETLVNGQAVHTPQALRQGDSIAVGRQAKGIVKMPLVIRGL